MAKGEAHKYHHYVHQCYLRQFAHEGNNSWYLHTLILKSKKQVKTSVEKVCGEDYFYSISDDYLKRNSQNDINKLSIELDYFAKNVELSFSSILSGINNRIQICLEKKIKNFLLAEHERKEIAKHIAIQYMRLPEVRKQNNEMFDSVMPKMIRLFTYGLSKELNNPDIAKLDIVASVDQVVNHAKSTYLDEELLNTFSNQLCNNYWSFFYSSTNSFYTSDSPIVAFGHADNICERNECLGLTRYGVETSFPLTPNLMLVIWDKRYFSKFDRLDGYFGEVTKDFLEHLNSRRLLYAKKYVFSYNAPIDTNIKEIKII